jgi:hypothetical protein
MRNELPDHLRRNLDEMAVIRKIIEGGSDGPILMININSYTAEAEYPSGDLYRSYIAGLERLLCRLGAAVKWQRPILGQPVGSACPADEMLAIWYPTHKAYLDLPSATGGAENYALRARCLERAIIYRCPADGATGASTARAV